MTLATELPDLRAPTVSVTYVRLIVDVAGDRGINPEQILRGLGISKSLLETPDALLSAAEYVAVVSRAIERTGDPGLGCEVGLRMPPTMHGFLGYAAVSAADLGAALAMAARYFKLASRFVSIRVQSTASQTSLVLHEEVPLGAVRRFVVETALIGLYKAGQMLVAGPGFDPRGVSLHFNWPRPPDAECYRHRLPPVRYGARDNRLSVPAAYLKLPLSLHDPLSLQRAEAMCESELSRLAERSLREDILAMLVLGRNGYPSLIEVAARLRLSPRALMRRLQREQITFRDLLNERRFEDAAALLLSPSVSSIDRIATRLGYADPANFARAFRRHTGESPTRYRSRMLGAAEKPQQG